MNPNNRSPHDPVLLSDLGNVLITVDRHKSVIAFSEFFQIPVREIEPYFHDHPLHQALERGTITAEKFLSDLAEELQLPESPDLNVVREILGRSFGENASVAQIIDQFRPRLKVFILSNTNPIDIPYIEKYMDVLQWADELILSYHTGFRKPESGIYEYTIRKYGLDPEYTLFLDDKPENVEAAIACGLQGAAYTPETDLNRLLWELVTADGE